MANVFYVNPPCACDLCKGNVSKEFFDTRMKTGQWGNLCRTCWNIYGVGKLGTGHGQHYVKQPDNRYLKIEG